MLGFAWHIIAFPVKFDKFNNTGAQMLDLSYDKLFEISLLA